MTNFRFKHYIPENDLTVMPRTFTRYLYDIFEKLLKDELNKYNISIINNIYKKIREEIENYSFWYKISSLKFCCYQFTDRNVDNITKICGKRIDIKYGKNDPNRFLCAKHNRSHISKSIKIDENNRCTEIKRNGEQCRYSIGINGICVKHYKFNNNIKHIKEVHEKINIIKEFNKTYCDIEGELNILNSINIYEDILSPKCLKRKRNNDLLNICTPHLEKRVKIHKNNYIEDIIQIVDDELDHIFDYLEDIKKETNNFIINCNNTINKKIVNIFDDDIVFDISNPNEINEIITNIINNKTYININYLEKSLKNYNIKFKQFKNEIKDDFPKYYKKMEGYFNLMENIFDYDIIRIIEFAKINSIFL